MEHRHAHVKPPRTLGQWLLRGRREKCGAGAPAPAGAGKGNEHPAFPVRAVGRAEGGFAGRSVGAWGAEHAGVRGALRAGPPRGMAGLSERKGGRSASGRSRGMWCRRSCAGEKRPTRERRSRICDFEPCGAGRRTRSFGDARAPRKGSRSLASLGMTGEACHPEPCAAERRISCPFPRRPCPFASPVRREPIPRFARDGGKSRRPEGRRPEESDFGQLSIATNPRRSAGPTLFSFCGAVAPAAAKNKSTRAGAQVPRS